MNVISMEAPFLNPQIAEVLSATTGANAQLREWVLSVNPFDPQEMAAGMFRGLQMPHANRVGRAAGIVNYVRGYDCFDWLRARYQDAGVGGSSRTLFPVFRAAGCPAVRSTGSAAVGL